MKAASVLLILSGVLSLGQTAWAGASDVGHGNTNPMLLAQLTDEERRALRDQWGRLPADERAALRQQFQERWRDLPPEQRESRRRELTERWRKLPPEVREERRREYRDDRGGYGQGYEYRQFEEFPAEDVPFYPARGGRR